MRKVLYLINSLKNGGPVNMLYSLCKYLDNTQYKIYVMALKKCDINARDFSNLNCGLIIINENNKLKRINLRSSTGNCRPFLRKWRMNSGLR